MVTFVCRFKHCVYETEYQRFWERNIRCNRFTAHGADRDICVTCFIRMQSAKKNIPSSAYYLLFFVCEQGDSVATIAFSVETTCCDETDTGFNLLTDKYCPRSTCISQGGIGFSRR